MAKKKGAAAGGLHDAAKTLGKAGGRSGGPARAAALTKGERQAIAKKGGEAAHAKKPPVEKKKPAKGTKS